MKIYSKLLVMGVIALLLLTVTSNFVSATQNQFNTQTDQASDPPEGPGKGGPPSDIGQNRRQYERRDIEVGRYQNRAVIESSWKGDRSDDRLNMHFNFHKDHPEISVQYEVEKKNKNVQFSFNLVFKEVFEYVDNNQNGRYDNGDNIINIKNLSHTQFKDIDYKDEEEGYSFSIETMDSSIGFDVRGQGEFIEHGSQILTPSEAKMDLKFNYDFERDDTMLGLKIDIQTQYQNHVQRRTFDEERGYANDERGLGFTKENYSGFFTWADNAVVDGENKPVNATFISETGVESSDSEINGNDVLYLCYHQGSKIVHDPKVGVVGESSLSFTSVEEEPLQFFLMVFVASIGLSAAVFYSGVYYRRKKD
ncbi:MAG: hypothetical protein ACOC5D_04105 [Thermoplasmatota archaeon]